MANKYMKKHSTSAAIKEMQIKRTLRFHLIPVRTAVIKTTKAVNSGEDVKWSWGGKEPLCTVGSEGM
jgi:hypothetical protein